MKDAEYIKLALDYSDLEKKWKQAIAKTEDERVKVRQLEQDLQEAYAALRDTRHDYHYWPKWNEKHVKTLTKAKEAQDAWHKAQKYRHLPHG